MPARDDLSEPPWRDVFLYFLLLGFINVGGPVAQITMMYNHMVENRHWLAKERFVQIMAFCHMLPGPEALQLAIYVGYLKRRVWGGILAGLTFILPGAVVMTVLSWLYVKYGRLPAVNDFLYILKPAVLGIIGAGILKLTRASIRSVLLAILLVGSFLAIQVAGINFLLVLLAVGLLNMLATHGRFRLGRDSAKLPSIIAGLGVLLAAFVDSKWLQLAWLCLKTGLFSFGGAYASLAFLQHGAVDQHRWLTAGQLLDGVALSIATPGPFMLFTTFVGFVAGGVSGAVIATFFVFLPSFLFVLGGAPYIEFLSHNRPLQSFLAGVSAGVVAMIVVVSIELVQAAPLNLPALAIAAGAFLAIVWLKVDVAFVALGAMTLGVLYALAQAVF
ncbi:MAG TPA: chromate efflux transporter [Pyrinomonadaceae bacterium]|nr:chromate efflux transporter [Pyrinomonadaceae bacterium]